jgi:hypothetical protein
MKDKGREISAMRQRLVEKIPDLSAILPGSLLSRMVRCNKSGCQYCQKQGKGHGPIWILSVSLGDRQVRQISIPAELKGEVEAGLRAFAQTQKLLKEIAALNIEAFKLRKQRR